MQSQVSRWRIPAISPIRLESPVVERGGSVFLVTLIESNREYERLLIGYQSLSGEKRLATGGEPQGASKRSNSDHRQRSNALLISLNVFPSAPDVGNGCFPKQYWAFLVGCRLFVGFLLSYALLERWRERSPHADECGNKNKKRHK
jgi:hypothetical protein